MKIIDIDLDRRRISLSIKQAAEGGVVAAEYQEHFGEHAYDEQGNYIGPAFEEERRRRGEAHGRGAEADAEAEAGERASEHDRGGRRAAHAEADASTAAPRPHPRRRARGDDARE